MPFGDPYSVYLDEDLYQELNLQIEGSFGGIGVEIDLDEEKSWLLWPHCRGRLLTAPELRVETLSWRSRGKIQKGLL